MVKLVHAVGWGVLCLAALGPAVAAPSKVVLSCAVAYLPQRSTWVREVRIDWDKKAIRSLQIDGLQPHGFSLIPQGVMTAVDNEHAGGQPPFRLDIGRHRRIEATSQAYYAHRSLLPAQLFEPRAHRSDTSAVSS
jgi:hypothetical protein